MTNAIILTVFIGAVFGIMFYLMKKNKGK